jgi:hypothetical protein
VNTILPPNSNQDFAEMRDEAFMLEQETAMLLVIALAERAIGRLHGRWGRED